MSSDYSAVVETAREYYNSDDADNFYFHIWGGEDIHIGLYQTLDQDISTASRLTVEAMVKELPPLTAASKVLDIGSGYGGAARYLAKKYGCKVVALNLSEKENERDRQMNKEQGVDQLIEVVDASFEKIPYGDNTFDVVWSQDAILHSGEREQVVAEAARVLKPGGHFVFTDIMQIEGVSKEDLQPVLDRIHLTTLGSLPFYRSAATKSGMVEVNFQDHTAQLPTHYGRVHQELEERKEEISKHVSDEYIERMKVGLQHWVEAGKAGRLEWGIMHFKKNG